MGSEQSRSRDGRDLAEFAMVALMLQMEGHRDDFVVIGGLNPDFLASASPVLHQGTTDVDVFLQIAVTYERDEQDFSWLESGLTKAGFVPRVPDDAWQWVVEVAEGRVMLDILCDVLDNPGRTIALPGCADVTALNMAGPAPAAVDAVSRSIAVPDQLRTSDASASEVDVRFAGLGGYLLAKSAAFLARSLDKDVYDFAFVLTYNAGGGRAAADAMREAIPAPPLRDYLADAVAVLRRLTADDAREREIFCEQMLFSGADEDRAVLNQDVLGAALDCLDRLAESVTRCAMTAAQDDASAADYRC